MEPPLDYVSGILQGQHVGEGGTIGMDPESPGFQQVVPLPDPCHQAQHLSLPAHIVALGWVALSAAACNHALVSPLYLTKNPADSFSTPVSCQDQLLSTVKVWCGPDGSRLELVLQELEVHLHLGSPLYQLVILLGTHGSCQFGVVWNKAPIV